MRGNWRMWVGDGPLLEEETEPSLYAQATHTNTHTPACARQPACKLQLPPQRQPPPLLAQQKQQAPLAADWARVPCWGCGWRAGAVGKQRPRSKHQTRRGLQAACYSPRCCCCCCCCCCWWWCWCRCCKAQHAKPARRMQPHAPRVRAVAQAANWPCCPLPPHKAIGRFAAAAAAAAAPPLAAPHPAVPIPPPGCQKRGPHPCPSCSLPHPPARLAPLQPATSQAAPRAPPCWAPPPPAPHTPPGTAAAPGALPRSSGGAHLRLPPPPQQPAGQQEGAGGGIRGGGQHLPPLPLGLQQEGL